jgi:phytoene synthase
MHDSFDSIPHNESDVIRHHSQSFSLAASLLPRNVRDDVKKLYAWCRWCDNAVDDAPSRELAEQRLLRLRVDVDRIYDNQEPIHAASTWLADLVRRYGIPREYPLDLLAGMEMDVNHRPIQSQEDLLLYCHRAAGSVGQMMCFLLGTSNVEAISHADSLGMAMQMTNIARDVKEDQTFGRCYLPKCWLDAVPLKEGLPTKENVQAAVKRLLALADQHYAIGIEGLQYLPSGSKRAIRIAADLYREIGETIRRNNYRVMDGRAFVPTSRKVVLVVKGLLRSRHQTAFTVAPVTKVYPFPFLN